MTAYRFCRTDDIGLLVEGLNRCWSPYFPGEPPMTPALFKRSIRDLQVWCSSCMVAFSGPDPVGVLIGAKRPWGTLVHKIAVHPDHQRQGHGRHLLTSLGSKLAILGPPRIIAEVPDTLTLAGALFCASGFIEEARLTDYVLSRHDADPHENGAMLDGSGRFVIPVTVDDLAANRLLGDGAPQVCWHRSVETLKARKDDIAGLAVVADERIEAYILYVEPAAVDSNAEAGAAASTAEIVALRTFVEDGGVLLERLLRQLRARGTATFRLPKVHPSEISNERLETLGFRPAGTHRLFSVTARAA